MPYIYIYIYIALYYSARNICFYIFIMFFNVSHFQDHQVVCVHFCNFMYTYVLYKVLFDKHDAPDGRKITHSIFFIPLVDVQWYARSLLNSIQYCTAYALQYSMKKITSIGYRTHKCITSYLFFASSIVQTYQGIFYHAEVNKKTILLKKYALFYYNILIFIYVSIQFIIVMHCLHFYYYRYWKLDHI